MLVCESTVEQASLTWLESLGWQVRYGSEIAPGGLFVERTSYGEACLSSACESRCYANLSKRRFE